MIGAHLHHREHPITRRFDVDVAKPRKADASQEQPRLQSARRLYAAIDDKRAGVMAVELNAESLRIIGKRVAEGGSTGVEVHRIYDLGFMASDLSSGS